MFHLGGAVARVPRDATAYRGRDAEHNIIIDAAWLPDQDDTLGAAETTWARSFLAALRPHRAGVYVNFLESDDDTSRVRADVDTAGRDESAGHGVEGGSEPVVGSARPNSALAATEDA